MSFKNFDETQQKVFLDGKEVKVDVFGSFNIPLQKESVIRVEEIDLANYIKMGPGCCWGCPSHYVPTS